MRLARGRDVYVLAIVGVITTLRLLGSSRLKHATARLIGAASFRCTAINREAAADGVARALGLPRDSAAVRHIVREAYVAAWQDLLALAGPRAAHAEISAVALEGREHLERALQAGRGAILWESNTFGRRVLGKLALSRLGYRVVQVHADNHLEGLPGGYSRRKKTRLFSSVIWPFFEASERPFVKRGVVISDAGGSLAHAKALSTALRENEIVAAAAEGSRGTRLVTAEVFGRQRQFATGMLSLARSTGAPILPLFCFRDEHGTLRLVIEEPLQVPSDREQAGELVQRHAKRIESYARRYPGQYRLWARQGEAPTVCSPVLAGGRRVAG